MYLSKTKYENFDFENPPEDSRFVDLFCRSFHILTNKLYKVDNQFYYYREYDKIYIYLDSFYDEDDCFCDEAAFEDELKSYYILINDVYYIRQNNQLEFLNISLNSFFKNAINKELAVLNNHYIIDADRIIKIKTIKLVFNSLTEIVINNSIKLSYNLFDLIKIFKTKKDAIEYQKEKRKNEKLV